MMLAKIKGAALVGIEALCVDVEVHLALGLPAFSIVGLPDTAIQEARERVRAAIANSGRAFPTRRIIVNLAPADVRKEGPVFDLSIALAILCASGEAPSSGTSGYLFLGELALDGSLRPIPGALAYAQLAKEAGLKGVVLPEANAEEASLIDGIQTIGAGSLADVIDWLRGDRALPLRSAGHGGGSAPILYEGGDMADVRAQWHTKRALEVAAAGGHNIMLVGPPGSGKSMLARRLPGILPAMSQEEMLEVTKIYSVARQLRSDRPLVMGRPFRAPHHTISAPGLIGGGSSVPRPGEVSLSHNGVLFLDEILEFNRSVLEVLRQPLEEGSVNLSRRLQTLTYPARFLLVAAANPCKCGYRGDQSRHCVCRKTDVNEYQARLSGPLIDRIDIHAEVPRLSAFDFQGEQGESSAVIAARVEAARQRQRDRRRRPLPGWCNARLTSREVRSLDVAADGLRHLAQSIEDLRLSARAYDRVLKMARTIADLAEAERIEEQHVSEALKYRLFDRQSSEGERVASRHGR